MTIELGGRPKQQHIDTTVWATRYRIDGRTGGRPPPMPREDELPPGTGLDGGHDLPRDAVEEIAGAHRSSTQAARETRATGWRIGGAETFHEAALARSASSTTSSSFHQFKYLSCSAYA